MTSKEVMAGSSKNILDELSRKYNRTACKRGKQNGKLDKTKVLDNFISLKEKYCSKPGVLPPNFAVIAFNVSCEAFDVASIFTNHNDIIYLE